VSRAVLTLVTAAWLAWGGTTSAYAQDKLVWKTCVAEARSQHPELAAAHQRVIQARADKSAARSALLPQLRGSIDHRVSDGSATDRNESYSWGVTGSQLLFDGFKTSNQVAAAGQRVNASRYDAAVVSSNIRLRLRTAFGDLLKAQALVRITESIGARRKQNLDLVELRYQAGREHRGSLLTAQANYAQAEYELAQARRNVGLAQRDLQRELGREHYAPLAVSGSFVTSTPANQRPDYELIVESNPLLQELVARRDAAKLSVRSARADFLPEVYLSANSGRSDSGWPPRDSEWSAGISVSVPLFEGGQRRAALAKARASLSEADAQLRSGRNDILYTLDESWTAFKDAVELVEVRRMFQQAAEERARIAQAQYSNGLISFDNWTIIEDDLVRARKTLLDTEANALVAEARWVQARGGTLADDV